MKKLRHIIAITLIFVISISFCQSALALTAEEKAAKYISITPSISPSANCGDYTVYDSNIVGGSLSGSTLSNVRAFPVGVTFTIKNNHPTESICVTYTTYYKMSEGEYLTGSSYRLLDFIEDYATSAGNGLYWNYNEGIGHFLSIEPGESVTVGFEDSPASAEIIYCLSAGYNDYTATTTRYPMGEPVYSRYAFIINDPVAGFIDVSASAYYADAVVWAVDNNVTDGVSKTKFAPSNTVSRAEAVTFLWRAYGRPEPTSTTSKFKDVTDTSAYYYKAVLWAAENGITTGVSDTWFDLKATLTFEQILTFLCRAAGGDASGDDWSNKALTWAKNNGVTGALSFSATDKCPRSDVVYCLYNQLAK